MARSLNKKFFGKTSNTGSQIECMADLGGGSVAASIYRQVNARSYLVFDSTAPDPELAVKVKCKLVNGAPAAPGEMQVQFTPFGGAATNAMKITAKKVVGFDGTPYTWSVYAPDATGEASLIGAADQAELTATAYAILATTGVINAVTITSGGTGYTVADVLTVAGGTGASATLTVATESGGVITSVTISNAGTGYTDADALTVTGGTGNDDATFTVESIAAAVASYVVTEGGSGYTGAPVVTVSGNATATAVVSNGIVTNVNVNAAGSGYTTAPTVSIAAP